MLDEISETSDGGGVEDEEGRDTVMEEVVRLVVPHLQKFTQKNKEFSRSSLKTTIGSWIQIP